MAPSTDHRAHYGDARHRLNPAQTIVALSALMILATCLWVAPIGTLQGCVGLSLVSSAAFLALRLASALTTMFDLHVGTSTDPHRDADPGEDRTKQPEDIPLTDFPTFTLLCPAYHEHDSINNLIRTLKCLDYPKDKVEILLLLEANDQKTLAAITEDLGHIQIVIRPEGAGPQTKPAALNYGLARSSGSIVGIYDAEDRPEREQLSVIARVMQADPRIQCVQAHLNYHNREETFITRMFALEYSLHFDYVLPGLLKLGLPIPLGGTSNFIRRPMLEKLGGWDAYNVTEDADLGLRLAEAGGRMAMASSTTYEEATEGPGPWIKQRSRWLKGYLQTWLVHTRRPMSLRTSIVLHGMLGAVVLNALAIPITTLMFAVWWLTEWAFVEAIFGGTLKFPSYFLLVGGNFIHAWLLAMAPLRRGWFGLSTEVFLLPLYWMLQSAAAYRALFGLMRNPSYWSKTDHSAGADPIRDVFHA